MIVSIGTDLCDSRRVDKLYKRFKEDFYQRILTPEEYTQLQQYSNKVSFVARRIAAKEAIVKALGTGFAQGVSWQHIRIDHLDSGQPYVTLSAQAKKISEQKRVTKIHLSISDEQHLASAFVVLENTRN